MRKVSVGNEHFALMSAGEICEVAASNMRWMRHQEGIQRGNGAVSTEQFIQKARLGDNKLVEMSEALLSKIEDQVPLSRGWRNIDDVVGAVPNIPAFLAGHPQNMRRRERAMRESAPLTIFMDLTSSMAINQDDILKRGIVLLALVRQLVAHRSVELWVGTSLGEGRHSCFAGWKIDTTPLDLARAAFHISDVSMSRLFGYATCEMLVNQHLGGFGASAKRNVELLKQIGGWHDLMYLPPIHHHDPMVSDPVGWLKKTMKQYVRMEEEDAA